MPVRGSLCLYWCETHTKDLRARFPTRPEEDKGRQEPKIEQKIAENKTEQRSGQNRAVNGSRGKLTARMCEPRGQVGQCESMSQHSWWLCGNFARTHAPDSLLMHGKLHNSVTNFSLLALGANSSPCLFVLFSSTLSVVYVVSCVSVKKCEIPRAGGERNHQRIWWPWVV